MKVIFLFQGLPHYYNYVLNRLNRVEGLEVINVVPKISTNLGEGVYESREDVEYKLYELDEYRIGWNSFFFRLLWKLLLKERPDVIVASTPHLKGFLYNVPTFIVRMLLGIRLILKSIPFRVPRYDVAKTGVRKLSRAFIRVWLNRFFWRLPNAHVNYIEDAYDIYGSYGVPREKIFITYNSPDTDRLLAVHETLLAERCKNQTRPHRFIHVGRLVEWKRVDLLLIALAGLKKKYPDADLLVIGDGPQSSALRNLAKTLGIDDSVQFLGGIYDPVELGRYLMSSAIYVLAGMGGLSINEAMCFGLPVICSVCDGTEKYLVKDGINGLFFREGDPWTLFEKIDFLFSRPEVCIQMGKKSLDIIREEINVHTVIRGYVRAFEFVTGKKLHVT
jgi:glycosyltransferase involved in cell wall biosynthesis